MAYIEEVIVSDDYKRIKREYFDEFKNKVSDGSKATLAVFEEPYEVISCKYIPLCEDKLFCLRSIRNASCIFQYLNKNVTEKDIRVWLRHKLRYIDNNVIPITPVDIGRVVRESFGKMEFTLQTKRTMWLKYWTNEKIEGAKKQFGEHSKYFYEVLVSERRKFAQYCFNYSKAKDARDRFLDAMEYVKEHYGYVSAEMVCEQLDISLDHFYRMRDKIQDMISTDEFEFLHGKATESRNRIVKAGEAVHERDKNIITKSRIHKKSIELKKPVTRPTINRHWDKVEPYFRGLDELLEMKEQ